jgi:hypothetical protein
MPLNHQHDWSQTSYGFKCVNCSAAVGTITPYLGASSGSGTYDSGTYDSGTYDGRGSIGSFPTTVVHGGFAVDEPDLIHLVDYTWFQMGGAGIPLS